MKMVTENIFPFFKFYIGFIFLLKAWDIYLELRQLKQNKIQERTTDLMKVVTHEAFIKSQAYNKEKRIFHLCTTWFTFALSIVSLWTGPFLWRLSAVWLNTENEFMRIYFMTVVSSLIMMILTLPISLYKDFVIEEKYGFNKKTLGLFFMDLLKSTLIELIMMIIILFPLSKILAIGGNYLHIYLYSFIQLFIIIMTFVYPSLIMPLFNKFEVRMKIDVISILAFER
jgi:STE24 endopeptidase